MEKDVWSFKFSDLFTIPNILTYIRFILIIPFAYCFVKGYFLQAAISLALSGLSDCFDGLAARKLNQVTALGKILDPVADKLTLIVVVLCMVIYVPVVLPVLITLLIKDVLMLLGGADLIKKGITPPSASWYGKLATVVFYFSVCVIVFLKAVINYENFAIDLALLSITAVTMLFALWQYGKIYFQLIKENSSNENSVIDSKNK